MGDVVILKNENQPRNSWRLGRVVETYTEDDGLVRKVKLALADANLNSKGKRTAACSFLDRPVHKLILLLETEEIPVKEPQFV